MSVNSIALFYGHVARNVGDVAINRGQLNLLKSAYPQATIDIVLLDAKNSFHLESSMSSFGPQVSGRVIMVATEVADADEYAVDPARWLETCEVEDADLIVLAAGEHLFSYAGHPNERNLFWRTLPAFAAIQAGRRCLLMPSTFGPYETDDAEALFAQLLQSHVRIAARDTQSAEILNSLGPRVPVDTALDPAFFLDAPKRPREGTEPRSIALVMRSPTWGLRLGVSGRSASIPRADKPEDDVAFQFSLALCEKLLAESKLEITMIIQTEVDRPIVEAVEKALGDNPESARFKPVTVYSIDDYLEVLSEVDCLVASRFHALILGMVCGKPGFGLYFDSHGHKIPGMMALLERLTDCANLSQVPPAEAVELAYAHCTAPPRFEQIGRRIDVLRKETLDWVGAACAPSESDDVATAAPYALFKLAALMMKRELVRVTTRLADAPSCEDYNRARYDLEKATKLNVALRQRIECLTQQAAELQQRIESSPYHRLRRLLATICGSAVDLFGSRKR